jgi:hypothetical protein
MKNLSVILFLSVATLLLITSCEKSKDETCTENNSWEDIVNDNFSYYDNASSTFSIKYENLSTPDLPCPESETELQFLVTKKPGVSWPSDLLIWGTYYYGGSAIDLPLQIGVMKTVNVVTNQNWIGVNIGFTGSTHGDLTADKAYVDSLVEYMDITISYKQ